MPFGFAVVPLVYMRKSRSSASMGSGGHVAGSSEPRTSWYQWSRPSVIGTSLPVLRTTTVPLIPGVSSSASSMIFFNATVVPRRHASSCVITNSHPMSLMRADSESAEKPPKTTVCGAPRRVQASIAIGSSGIIPM